MSKEEKEGKALHTLDWFLPAPHLANRAGRKNRGLRISQPSLPLHSPAGAPVWDAGSCCPPDTRIAARRHAKKSGDCLGKNRRPQILLGLGHSTPPGQHALSPDSKALPWQPAPRFTNRSKWNSLALGESSYHLHFRKSWGTLGDTWTHQDSRNGNLGARRTSLEGGDMLWLSPLLLLSCILPNRRAVLIMKVFSYFRAALPSSVEQQEKRFSFLPLNRSGTRLKHKS